MSLSDKKSYVLGHVGLDFLDNLSKMRFMNSNADRKWIEAEAIRLGANPSAVFKWRKRGVPARWQLRLIEGASCKLSPNDITSAFPAQVHGGVAQ